MLSKQKFYPSVSLVRRVASIKLFAEAMKFDGHSAGYKCVKRVGDSSRRALFNEPTFFVEMRLVTFLKALDAKLYSLTGESDVLFLKNPNLMRCDLYEAFWATRLALEEWKREKDLCSVKKSYCSDMMRV
jgi:hypothetical protein